MSPGDNSYEQNPKLEATMHMLDTELHLTLYGSVQIRTFSVSWRYIIYIAWIIYHDVRDPVWKDTLGPFENLSLYWFISYSPVSSTGQAYS